MAQTREVTGVEGYATIHPKPHAHIILMHMSVKHGLSKYGEKVTVHY